MSELELNKMIANNINKYLLRNGKNQIDLAIYMNVSQATVSNWCKGLKMPRMDKIDKICTYLNINRSDLMEDKFESESSSYYLNEETKEIAQEIFDNPDMKSLFDMSRKMTPERLKAHLQFMKSLQDSDKQ